MDELGDLPLFQQIKLLRVLETKTMTRVGSDAPVQVDFRLVAATNQHFPELVKVGNFRADLFYRLAVIELTYAHRKRVSAPESSMSSKKMAGKNKKQPKSLE